MAANTPVRRCSLPSKKTNTNATVVLVLPDGVKSIDLELKAADELMYQAKKSRAGVLVASLSRRDGKIALSPPVSMVPPADRGSSVRQAGREGGLPANAAREASPPVDVHAADS
jgi:hypothetical protein